MYDGVPCYMKNRGTDYRGGGKGTLAEIGREIAAEIRNGYELRILGESDVYPSFGMSPLDGNNVAELAMHLHRSKSVNEGAVTGDAVMTGTDAAVRHIGNSGYSLS